MVFFRLLPRTLTPLIANNPKIHGPAKIDSEVARIASEVDRASSLIRFDCENGTPLRFRWEGHKLKASIVLLKIDTGAEFISGEFTSFFDIFLGEKVLRL